VSSRTVRAPSDKEPSGHATKSDFNSGEQIGERHGNYCER
jgi:hypothetical protein